MKKILILDDLKEFALTLESIFNPDHFNVSVFFDPIEALEHFKVNKDQFDLLITDFKMPKMDGLSFSKKIRELNQKVPIIMMTAHSDHELVDDASEIHINEYIEKPFDLESLLLLVNKSVSSDQKLNKRIHNFYLQLLKTLEMAANNQMPNGFTSVDFIYKTFEKAEIDPEILNCVSEVISPLRDHITFMDAIEQVMRLKKTKDQRILKFKAALEKLKTYNL